MRVSARADPAPLRLAHGMAMSSKPHLLRRVENILARRGAPASPRLAPGRAALVVIVSVLAVSGMQRAWAALPASPSAPSGTMIVGSLCLVRWS